MLGYRELLTHRKVESYAELAEKRLGRTRPSDRNHYEKTRTFFFKYPLLVPGSELIHSGQIRLFALPKYHQRIVDIVTPCLEEIANISGTYPSNVLIFAGPGKVMARNYRSIGVSEPPYEFAIYGADTCFINTDWIDMLGDYHPAVNRAVAHESNHAAWNFVLSDEPHYGFVTDLDITVHEALGGPLGSEGWKDVLDDYKDLPNFDFTQLRKYGNFFWPLIGEYQKRFGFNQPYFMNPVVASFYQWASSEGDIKYWYDRGLALRPKVKETWVAYNLLEEVDEDLSQFQDFPGDLGLLLSLNPGVSKETYLHTRGVAD